MKKLLLIFGGKSAEHEVSIISANSLLQGFNSSKYEVVPLKIEKDGKWSSPLNSKKDIYPELHEKLIFPEIASEGLFSFISEKIDVVFPLLHGTFGEDGTIQGFFEILGKPYVGAGVLGSSIGMDKDVTKIILKNADIPIVPSKTITSVDWNVQKNIVNEEILTGFQFPVFVKPCNSGSSIGISKVKNQSELVSAIEKAFLFDDKILIELGLSVREIEVSVLGNDHIEVSLPGEIHPGAEFYDYKDKYHSSSSWSEIPANLDADLKSKIQTLAQNAFKVLNLSGMARIDFFIDKSDNKIYLNEVNTIPGFTPISMYPKMWKASGLNYTDLIEKLIELALERFNKKEKIASNFQNLK